MKTKIFTLALFVFLFSANAVFSQENQQDVVYLTNGNVIRGTITEKIENQFIRIKTTEGDFVFSMNDIEKMEKEPFDENSKAVTISAENSVRNTQNLVRNVEKIVTEKVVKANSVFSQNDEVFNKKMYLGVNGAGCFIIIEGDLEGVYNIDLEFERQFHKHWGYTAGFGVLHLMSLDYVNKHNNIYSPSIYFQIFVGMKFYSKIINASMGVKPQWLLRWLLRGDYLEDDSAYQIMKGTYLTISKDFAVFRNFKIEPYIQGYIELYQPGFFFEPSVGLRLKYEFK